MEHQFYSKRGIFVKQKQECLIVDDKCKYCNLIITIQISKKFIYDKEYDETNYDLFLIKTYNKLNKIYKCITDEEYIIKNY